MGITQSVLPEATSKVRSLQAVMYSGVGSVGGKLLLAFKTLMHRMTPSRRALRNETVISWSFLTWECTSIITLASSPCRPPHTTTVLLAYL